MRPIVALAAAGLLLGGCAAPLMAAGGAGGSGFAAGYFANAGNDLALFNDALKVDAPLKALYCVTHEPLPPVWEAYCQHIPTDASQVPATFLYMLNSAQKP